MTSSIQPIWIFLAANGLIWLMVICIFAYVLWRRRERKNPERFLRTPEVARFLGLSESTLAKHRVLGTGPMYQKLGGRVVYKIEDLKEWAKSGRRKSTTEAVTERILPTKRNSHPAGKGSGV